MKCYKSVLLLLTFGLITVVSSLKAQLYYANPDGSQIKISGNTGISPLRFVQNNFSCGGNFTMMNGTLQKLSSLKFSIPLNLEKDSPLLLEPASVNSSKADKNINFELTNAMVLPLMNKIHIIGFLTIEGKINRVDLQLDYVENDENTITIMGNKLISLADYKKTFSGKKSTAKVWLNLKLVLKKSGAVDYLVTSKKLAE